MKLVTLIAILMLVGCGDSADMSGAAPNYDGRNEGNEPGQGVNDDSSHADAGTVNDASEEPFVPETESDFRLQPPAASQTFVFVANTDLNSVARIDSLTLQIATIEVGLEPSVVRTGPLGDMAFVLNEGSSDVSVVRADLNEAVETVEVVENANSLVLSPRGDFAIAYYDDRQAEPDDRPGSLSDATLIALHDEGEVVANNLVVGLHIREIEFDDTGDTAYFVTDDGVAVVEMASITGDVFVTPVRVSEDFTEDASAVDREVEVMSSGLHALVRVSTDSVLRLVDLDQGDIFDLDLGAVPTDLDLLPTGDSAVAVLRETAQVAVIPIPGAFTGDEAVDLFDLGEEVVGLAQLLPSGRELALFSTVDENDHLSILDLDERVMETVALRKGIEAVYPSPDGNRLLVFHTKLPGAPIPGTDEFLGQSFAYTVFNLTTGTARLVLTDARPGAFTFTEDGEMVFVILADEARGVMAVEWANLVSGRDETIQMRRLPQSIGVIPATGRIFVSQEHEVGRIAFIDPDSGEVREVTGYHLNSRTE